MASTNNSAKAKDFDFPRMISQFGGYISSVDRTNIAENFLVRGSQNVYKKLSGTIAVRQGQKRQGAANSTASACYSEYVWNTSWGETYTMVVSDSKLYVVLDEVWYVLQSSLTKTRYVFDKWWNTTRSKDQLIFVNGTTNLFSWGGGYGAIASTTANTIVLDRTIANSYLPAASGSVVVNGTTYAYTGSGGSTLTGVTPSPVGEANGSAVFEAVVTTANTPTSTFNSDFLKIVNNQVYLGSYTSLNIFMSQNTDYTNYTVPTPQLDGSPGLFILPGVGRGIGVRQGNAVIGAGTRNWVEISFSLVSNNNIITRNNKVDYKPVARLQAPYAHEFIDSVGDTLVYLGQDQQVHAIGDFNNLFVSGYPSYSQEIARELQQENFSGGGLKAIGEFIYVTAPNSGKVYLRQERTRVDSNGSIVAERLWHSPFVWNASFIDEIDGVVVAFSNANPQIYEVWDTGQWHDDSPSDEPLPYKCVAAFGYRGEQRRQGLWSFDKQFTEGYITAGTPLTLTVNYNYQGSTNIVMVPVNSLAQPAFIFQTSQASLGDSSLGDEPLGDGGISDTASDPDTLPKFKVINSLPIINCFEWQPVYSSEEVDAQWELLAVATNSREETEQLPTFIINKIRNV